MEPVSRSTRLSLPNFCKAGEIQGLKSHDQSAPAGEVPEGAGDKGQGEDYQGEVKLVAAAVGCS